MDLALTATVVHDLKNALGVLTAELASLRAAAQGGELGASAARAHAISAQLSTKLIAFLTLYRAGEDSGLQARPDAHCPADFLAEVAQSLVLPVDSAPVQVITDDALPPFRFFDAYLARLAVEAAVQNASRYARSAITLSAVTRDDHLVLVVEDDGPGLQSNGDDEPASAAAAAEPQSSPSTGLGTALCGAIAQAHRNGERCGRIVLANRVDATGARFELWLP